MLEGGEPERFREWIAGRFGLHFDDAKLGFLAEVLERRAERRKHPPADYLAALDKLESDDERRALACELTVPETYFFRHFEQFRSFTEIALPQRMAARADSRRLSILSAGCASGEEAYSLAILTHEFLSDPHWTFSIRAVDINRSMLEKAARGRYSAWAMRETPAEIQQRWFTSEGRDMVLAPSIRLAVQFQEDNLAADSDELWGPDVYDVIFCRNVMMYFTPGQAKALVARLTRSLAVDGYLFLGHAETLRGLSSDYALCHTHDTFYYQRKDNGGHRYSGPAQATLPTASSAIQRRNPDHGPDTTWMQAVQRSSERIKHLTERSLSASADLQRITPRGAAQTAVRLQLALEQLKEERFSDALALLSDLQSESTQQDLDVVLLRAALLTHTGQLGAAEQTCKELLERDELNTGGHYLLALCRENAGDQHGAVEHDQAAAYLDPEFAMPRLHLGLMARRRGDLSAARRELHQALSLLQREDTSRLLLFGGGFGRDALLALCRAELQLCGGAR